MGTDAEWKKWANADPYYAVLSTDEYRSGASRDQFFQSGETHFYHVANRFDALHLTLDKQGDAIDFGCGVGRVLAPMSRYFARTVGIDVSQHMLDEARVNTKSDADLRLLQGNDLEACLQGRSFQFIHSALVFQHITPKRGLALLEILCGSLANGGKMMVELPIAARFRARWRLSQALKANPLLCKAGRFLLRRPNAFEPIMQMHIYPTEHLLALWQQSGLEVRFLTQHPDGDVWQGAWHLYKPGNSTEIVNSDKAPK